MEAEQREALLDDAAKHPGYFFADVFRKTAAMLATERWPFPPGDHVTLARIVHLLAFRTVARRHESMPAGQWVNAPHEARYLAYLDTVLTLNEAIDRAAKAGALRLRDKTSGVAVPDWHLPSWDRRGALKRAILEGDQRRAIDFVVSTDWLIAPYPHYSPALTVSRSEFSAWAEGEGIAAPGEVAELLQSAPKELPSLAGALGMFFGGPELDLDAGLYPESRREPERLAGQVVAEQGALDSEKSAPPPEWARGVRRVAWDAAKSIMGRGEKLTATGLEQVMLDSGRLEFKDEEYQLKSTDASLSEREMKVKPRTIAGWVTDLKKRMA